MQRTSGTRPLTRLGRRQKCSRPETGPAAQVQLQGTRPSAPDAKEGAHAALSSQLAELVLGREHSASCCEPHPRRPRRWLGCRKETPREQNKPQLHRELRNHLIPNSDGRGGEGGPHGGGSAEEGASPLRTGSPGRDPRPVPATTDPRQAHGGPREGAGCQDRADASGRALFPCVCVCTCTRVCLMTAMPF